MIPRLFTALLTLSLSVSALCGAPPPMSIPDDFPRFVVPGHDDEMESMRRLYWLHYQNAGPLITLWDAWMPMSTLWPAMGSGAELDGMQRRWASALAGRGMNSEGYV